MCFPNWLLDECFMTPDNWLLIEIPAGEVGQAGRKQKPRGPGGVRDAWLGVQQLERMAGKT
jgi:hypothetical protein